MATWARKAAEWDRWRCKKNVKTCKSKKAQKVRLFNKREIVSTCLITTFNTLYIPCRGPGPEGYGYPFEAVERSTLSKPATTLHSTEAVMSLKLSQVGNFFIRATNAKITLSSTIKNCFRIFDAP